MKSLNPCTQCGVASFEVNSTKQLRCHDCRFRRAHEPKAVSKTLEQARERAAAKYARREQQRLKQEADATRKAAREQKAKENPSLRQRLILIALTLSETLKQT